MASYDPYGGGGDPYAQPEPTYQASAPATPQPAASNYYEDQKKRIADAYKTYLGREGSDAEYQTHLTSPWANYLTPGFIDSQVGGIQNSQEAQAYRSRPQTAPTPTTPAAAPAPTGGDSGGGAQTSGGPVFNDPATGEWEQMVRALSARLNQPSNVPDFAPLTDYMRQYFQQLQQPAHTPAQMDLLQTQALDPMERQHQSARQEVIQRLAARGIAPSSGIVERALQDLDQQYQQLRTKTQAGFATNEIDLNRQNAAQAMQVGGALASLEAAQQSGDEQRALQALSVFTQIPNRADSRLSLANQTLAGSNINPIGLLSNLGQFQQTGLAQNNADSNYWAGIGSALAHLFGL